MLRCLLNETAPWAQQTRTWKIWSQGTWSLSFPMVTTVLLPTYVLLTLDSPQFFRVPVPLPKLSPLCRKPPPRHLQLAKSLPSFNGVITSVWFFSVSRVGVIPSGFYLSKLRAATTVSCWLHVVILKCSKHSVSIHLLWIHMKYLYKTSNPIIVDSPGLDDEPLEDGCHVSHPARNLQPR